MKKRYTFLTGMAIMGWCAALAGHLQPHIQFTARLDGAQEVPTVTTDALGVASFTLNDARDTLCVRGHFTGLSGPITGAHIHEGVAGVSGPVLVGLTGGITDNTLSTMVIGDDVTPDLIAALMRGELYINVHTDMYPDGEIRGQIRPETDIAFNADLDGAQEVPAVITSGQGLATFLLARHNGKLQYRVVVDSLSGPITAAHLHLGAPGVSGGVVLDLGTGIDGNTISGEADPEDILADLLAGDLYINVHTEMHPGGEIRGQVLRVKDIPFDSWMDGAQEVPPVPTPARGITSLRLTADMDSLWYDVLVTGLTGPVEAAHLHLGPVGESGGVVVGLNGIMGNRLQGWVTDLTTDSPLITDLLRGDIYVNVHTAMFPTGEVRGQVYRYLREGYTVWMDGIQSNPANTSEATGGGIVSVDRDQTNAHIMLVMDIDVVTVTHLHQGMFGEDGPVIFDLVPFLSDNGVFAYWTAESSVPFTTEHSLDLRNGNIYANVHNEEFPDGEIRGQVVRGSPCSSLITAIGGYDNSSPDLLIYPVPTSGTITVEHVPSGANLRIVDMQGRTIAMPAATRNADRIVLDVTALPAGMYHLWFSAGGTSTIARFVKD